MVKKHLKKSNTVNLLQKNSLNLRIFDSRKEVVLNVYYMCVKNKERDTDLT